MPRIETHDSRNHSTEGLMFFLQEFQVLGTDRERSHKEKLWKIIFSGEFFSYFCLNMSHEPPFWLHICPESLDFRKLLKHLKLTYSVKPPLCCCIAFRPQCCLPDLHQAVPHAHPRVHTWQTVVRNCMSHATKGLGQSYLGSPLVNLQWSNKGPYDLHDTPASSGWLECLGLQDRWLTITTPMMLSWWFAVVLYIPKRITNSFHIGSKNSKSPSCQPPVNHLLKRVLDFFHIRRIRMSSIVMSKQFLLQLIKRCHYWLYGNWFVHPLIHPISTKTLEADSCTFLNQGSDSLERRKIQSINNTVSICKQGFLDNYHNESP